MTVSQRDHHCGTLSLLVLCIDVRTCEMLAAYCDCDSAICSHSRAHLQAAIMEGQGSQQQRDALERLLSHSEAIATRSKRALDATACRSHHQDDGRRGIAAMQPPPAAAPPAAELSAELQQQLHALQRELAALLPRLPPAVTNDSRCAPLHAALSRLHAPQHDRTMTAGSAEAVLAAARTALDTVAAALASFAGDLRTAHLCRVEAEEARRAAEAAAADARVLADGYRGKRDEATRYGQVCLSLAALMWRR